MKRFYSATSSLFSPTAIRCFLCFLLGLVALTMVTGCGGMDQDDIRAHAIKRTPDPEDEEKKPARAPQTAPGKAVAAAKRAANALSNTVPEELLNPAATAAGTATAPAARVASNTPVAATSTAPSAPPTPSPTIPSRQPSADPQERARQSVANLEKIVAAMEAYRQDKGVYPPWAIKDSSRTPLLSWRVELLPYLGYDELYQQFDQTQPWYTPQNKALLAQIPPEYQSPERFDTKTNYLLPTGSSTIFPSLRTLNEGRIEDGLTNTVMLVEVDDELAAEWTEPKEYEFNAREPGKGLGSLRKGQIFLSWGGGLIGSVSRQTPAEKLKAIFTADGTEPVTMASVNRSIDFSALAGGGAVASVASRATDGGEKQPGQTTTSHSASGGSATAPAGASLATAALASKYHQAASAALELERPTDAWRWYYGAVVSGIAPRPAFPWYPALRRPAIGVHLAIGWQPESNPDLSAQDEKSPSQLREAFLKANAPVGDHLLSMVERHAGEISISQYLESGTTQQRRVSRRSGAANSSAYQPEYLITYLKPDSELELRQQATAVGCDLLLLLEPRTNSRGTARTVVFTLFDVVRREPLLPPQRLIAGGTTIQDVDPEKLKEVIWRLKDLLKDGLSPQPWPVPITEPLAKKRVASLATGRDPFPLRALAEMQYYRDLGVIDNAQLLRAVQTLLGDVEGGDLLLGDEAKRQRVLRSWMPLTSLEEILAHHERRQQRRDDD